MHFCLGDGCNTIVALVEPKEIPKALALKLSANERLYHYIYVTRILQPVVEAGIH